MGLNDLSESDNSLLQRLGGGDHAAFEVLFLRHYDRVYRVSYGLVANREAAEDLAQEAFMELHRRAANLQPNTLLAAWLCRVALNKGYNTLRGEGRAQRRLESFATSQQDDAYAELVRIEDRTRVRAVLARLHERQSKLLLLRYAGFSLAEMAIVLDVAPSSVGTLLARAERAFAAAYDVMHPAEADVEREQALERGNDE